MLQLDATPMTIDGLTIFRDHADLQQFWYLPGPVVLARRPADGRSAFSFMKFKRAPGSTSRGGGFLTFEVSLRPDPETERRILARLSSVSRGTPRLAAVPFDDGTVQCIALNTQGGGGTRATPNEAPGSFRAVETILGAVKPSLQADNTAAFSLELSVEGAILLEQAFKERTTPIGVIYDLKYSGMRPAFNVRITADFKQIFTHFSTAVDGQRGFMRAGIDAGFDRLTRNGAIKIEVLDFTNSAENEIRIKEALDFFKQQVLNTWFTPVLTPGTQAATPAQTASLEQVRALGAQLRPPQPPAPPPEAAQPGQAPTDHGPSPTEGTGQGAAPPGLPAAPVTAEGAADASPTEGSGNPPAPIPAPGSGAAAVAVRRTGGTVRAVADTPNAAAAGEGMVVAFRLKTIRQDERRTAVFEYNRAQVEQRTYAPQGFIGLLTADLQRDRHFVEIDLDDAFYQTISIEAKAPFQFTEIGLAEIHMALDYGPSSDPINHRHHEFMFSPDDRGPKTHEFAVNLRKDRIYQVVSQFHFDPASGWEGEKFSYQIPPSMTEDRTLIANPNDALGFMEVRLEPHAIDFEIVEFIDVDLVYQDPSGWTREKSFRFTEETGPQTWKLRLSIPAVRGFTYKLTHRLKDGTTRESPMMTSRVPRVLVEDPFPGLLNVTIFPMLEWEEIRAAMLDVSYEDTANNYRRSHRIRLTPALNETSVRFSTVNPALKRYRHQLTIVRNDGTTERLPAIETEDDIISLTGGSRS